MQLYISGTDKPGVWNWIVKYGETILGNYLLREVNSSKGTYLLDENNSILLDYFFWTIHFIAYYLHKGVF
jgi:hypothetical protein